MWRPDIQQYNAYMIRQAPASAKADSTARMRLLPDTRMYGAEDWRDFLSTSQNRLADDAGDLMIACPAFGMTTLDSASWAVTSEGPAWNITGPTNTMQAGDCGAGCAWTGEKSINSTSQVL
jgi:hypothetical protein